MIKSLAFTKPRKFTTAQQQLYALICLKIKNNEKLLFEEARQIYIKYVNRYLIDGVPHHWNYWADRHLMSDGTYGYTSKLEPMNDEEITFCTQEWLITNIGRLVIKGALDVIPQIELKQLA